MNRPPDSRSSVAPDLATTNGFRYGSTPMFGISSNVDVRAAAEPAATNGAIASWPPDSSHRCVGAGWSVNPKPSNPAASAAAATVAMPDPVTNSGLYGWLCIGWANVNFIFGAPLQNILLVF